MQFEPSVFMSVRQLLDRLAVYPVWDALWVRVWLRKTSKQSLTRIILIGSSFRRMLHEAQFLQPCLVPSLRKPFDKSESYFL